MELCIRPQFKVGDKVWVNGMFSMCFDHEVEIKDIRIDEHERRFIYRYEDKDTFFSDNNEYYDFVDTHVGSSYFKTKEELEEYQKQF